MSIFIFLFVFAKLKKKRNAQKRLEGQKSHVPQELTIAYLRLAESSREGCTSMLAGHCNCATTGGLRRFKPIGVSPGTPPPLSTPHTYLQHAATCTSARTLPCNMIFDGTTQARGPVTSLATKGTTCHVARQQHKNIPFRGRTDCKRRGARATARAGGRKTAAPLRRLCGRVSAHCPPHRHGLKQGGSRTAVRQCLGEGRGGASAVWAARTERCGTVGGSLPRPFCGTRAGCPSPLPASHRAVIAYQREVPFMRWPPPWELGGRGDRRGNVAGRSTCVHYSGWLCRVYCAIGLDQSELGRACWCIAYRISLSPSCHFAKGERHDSVCSLRPVWWVGDTVFCFCRVSLHNFLCHSPVFC